MTHRQPRTVVIAMAFLGSIALLASPLFLERDSEHAIAQDTSTTVKGPILQTEGISGDIDKKRRSPVVSLSTQYFAPDSSTGERVKILVDAYVPNKEYEKYPIKFDFFVNRQLVTTQIRSVELPGPIGIDVLPTVAKVPFNYSVVATLLHPNREFTTVLQGAAFSTNLGSTYTCRTTISSVDGNAVTPTVYVANEVAATQSGNTSISLSFPSSQLEDGSGAEELVTSSSLTLSEEEASGTITTTLDGRSQTVAVTGNVVLEDGKVTSFAVESEDTFTKLSCE